MFFQTFFCVDKVITTCQCYRVTDDRFSRKVKKQYSVTLCVGGIVLLPCIVLFMSLNHLHMHFVCSIRRFFLIDSSYSKFTQNNQGSSSSSSYGSWIYNYLCNQCLSPLKLWVRTSFMSRCILYNIIWQSLSVTCDRSVVSLGTLVFSTNKTDLAI